VQTLQLTDTDTTKIQDKDVVLLPSGLKAGKTYTVMVPKHSFRYLTVDYSYSFSTRAEDTMPPSTVISSPAGTQAKLALDPKVPYVLFSEKVTATAAKLITFKRMALRSILSRLPTQPAEPQPVSKSAKTSRGNGFGFGDRAHAAAYGPSAQADGRDVRAVFAHLS
jgi:hypothetical protein